MGFGNSPAGDMTGMIPGGTTPHIVNVRYAGTYPLRHGITNPPLTTPQFPSNPPRTSSTAPVAAHRVNDQLTLTRPTHTMLGALPAGAYKGSVGQVVRGSDPDSGAHLRGVMLAGRLAAGGVGSLRGLGAGSGAMRTPAGAMALECGATQEVSGVASFRVESGAEFVQCQIVSGRLQIKGLLGTGSAVIVYNLTGAVGAVPVDHVLPVTVAKTGTGDVVLAASIETASKIKDLLASQGAPAAPVIDWQDAAILRATYAAIRAPLRDLYGRIGCGPTCMRQCQQMMDILSTAVAHPELQTLRQVLEVYASERTKTVANAVGAVVGAGPDPAYKKALNAAIDTESVGDVVAVANVIVQAALTVVGTLVPAAAAVVMGIALAAGAATDALQGSSAKKMIRAFGPQIRRAAFESNVLPVRLVGNALVRTQVIQTGSVLLAQAAAGFAGTAAQSAAFKTAYQLLVESGLDRDDAANGLRPDPAFTNMLRAIKTARPDLCGLSSSLAPTLAEGTASSWAATNPLWASAEKLGFVGGLVALYFAFNPRATALPAAQRTTYKGRVYASLPALLREAHTEYAAALAAAAKPLPDVFRARLARTLTTLALIGRGVPGRVAGHPEVLSAAGIPPATFPSGYGEFLDPLPPGQEARPTQTVNALMGAQLPGAGPTGSMTEPDVNAALDAPRPPGPGPGPDPVKTSSNAPLLIGGAVVAVGLVLLLR